MIVIVNEDLLKSKEEIIGHQVNCQGVMRSGIALQIKNKFPEAYNSYIKKVKSFSNVNNLLGEVDFAKVKPNNRIIANLFGQKYYGYDRDIQYTDYDALIKCLSKLKDYAQKNNLTVALPYNIGCDRGGGDWNYVYSIIDKIFEDYEITLYKYNKE